MASSKYAIDDSNWFEVRFINGYAVFMGYLMMGVRGLGLLVITWTTVVLLGGFVSDLGKKDFWCLTGIMLVQTAGVFNVLLKETLSDMVHSWWGVVFSVIVTTFRGGGKRMKRKQIVTSFILLAIQVLVFGIILCPVGALYMLGLYISAGLSLWRLIEHDFGDAGGANQKPTLQVLYILAVLQGVLFGYKVIYGRVLRMQLQKFAAERGMVTAYKELIIEGYLGEIIAGCKKDPSFATGKNLVTYGVDLMMEAKSNEGFIAGIKALSDAITMKPDKSKGGREVLAKHLLLTSSSYVIQRLLETVGHRSPYDRETKERALMILVLVAPSIHLEQFPRAIECLLSCVVDTTDEQQIYRNNNDDPSSFDDIKFKDYERFEPQQKDEQEEGRCKKSVDSCDFSLLSILMRWLVQCLVSCSCKRKTIQSEAKESRRKNTAIHGFNVLLAEAIYIIHQIAADEHNRRILPTCIVFDTMLHKVARAPRKLHRDNHEVSSVYKTGELLTLERCWVLTEWLLPAAVIETNNTQICRSCSRPLQPATPLGGGGGRRRRSGEEIEDEPEEGEEEDENAIRRTIKMSIKSAIKSIFDCLDCRVTEKMQGIRILLHLSLDMSFLIKDSESSKRRLTWILLLIFGSTLDDSKYRMIYGGFVDRNSDSRDRDHIKRLVVEKLSEIILSGKRELPPSQESERELIRVAVGDLTRAFDDDDEDISIRIHATIIMEGLCVHYWSIEPQVQTFLVGAIPKVLKGILIPSASTRGEDRQPQATADVENGGALEDGNSNKDKERLRKALASLCKHGYGHIKNKDATLEHKFKEALSKICEEEGKSIKDFKSLVV